MKNLLNPKWLLIINTLPIAILFLLFLSDYNIIKTLLTEDNLTYWKGFGFALFVLASSNLIYTLVCIGRKKNISIYYGFISLTLYIIFIYQYNVHSNSILPWSIPRWMLSGDLLLYVGTFLMPTLAHALFIIVIRLTSTKKDYKAWHNLLLSLAVPLVWYFFFQVILPFWRIVDSGFGEHTFIILMIIGVIIFLFFLIRSIYILSIKKGGKWKKYQLVWKIPIAILFPLLGLLVNTGFLIDGFANENSGVFGDFNSYWFYIIALVNGILICLPNTKNKTYRLALFIGRSITLTFTLYFFIVFLPFLPLSVIAVIAIGVGFLMLTPLVLFIIHIQELVSDYSFLKQHFSKLLLITISLIGFFIIPISLSLSYHQDKLVLHKTLDYIYSPNYSKDYNIDKKSLKKTLNTVRKHKVRRNDFLSGNQTPYLSPLFNWIVLDNLTLSDSKINMIEQIFFNAESLNIQSENIRNNGVNISNITSTSIYNQVENNWTSWINIEITNTNSNNFNSEYATTIDLPNGCWINDYYLYVGDKKEMGILAEKKSAMWVFSQIRNENKDPGLLYYLTGNKVSFRVFPFAEKEVRKTGIQFIHKEPITINIDNHEVALGDSTKTEVNYSSQNQHVAYVSSLEKKSLKKVSRNPYYHFIIDISAKKENLIDRYAKTINQFLEKNPLKTNHKISFTNSYSKSIEYNEDWEVNFNKQTFEGGFYLERAIKKIYFEAYKTITDSYPIIIVVTDNMLNSIISKDFKDFKIAFPESNLFYHLNTLGHIASHDLTNNPKESTNDNISVTLNHSVLTWPNSTNSLAYLANNKQSDIILKSTIFKIDENEIKKSSWNSGLLIQGKWLSHILHPERSENEWNKQVKYSFIANIMSPLTSYIVVENEAQKAILKKKQEEVLSGKKSLDLNEETQRMSEPRLIFLFVLFGIFLLLKQKRLKLFQN
ncbi:MSEP-CTERM sorting domain-containing protein [Flaviramulus sp. BrNp1-15]|uniref:MSEP-CTERM sorting domain-containing protein n=1 Tax=Flaviramulus sp. BrNp1-15 TaxID=2916754 RepID=UPI001EE81F08|nr:MSEP-CTERM sorting domain-containing protein [Flaviramulus sp. BrNp1-15]ULC59019.1 MSEP-CTERM sorting domain-containing protein [Flaviramulus sp. BrNp1-15]